MEEVDIYEGLRGYIRYPCGCKAKILVYEGTCGKTSIRCPICGRYAVFYYDSMTAEKAKATCGAISFLKRKAK